MMKGCYDYYLNYYNEKYGVQPSQEQPKQAEVASVPSGSGAQKVSPEKEKSSVLPGLAVLVAYSESDSE